MNLKLPLLDLGNVVIRVNWEIFFDFLQKNARPDTISSNFGHSLIHSSLFYDFEFGNIGPKEFVSRTGRLCGTEFNETDFLDSFCAILPDWMPEMPQVLESLCEKGPVYGLSNTNEVHLRFVFERFPEIKKYFKVIYASHEIKKRKPYPGTYREITKQMGCAPNQVVFFDDLEPNVNGARRAGLEAHVYVEPSQIKNIFFKPKESV